MTVIAFDGTTLAADKKVVFDDGSFTRCTKIWRRFDGVIYGLAGEYSKCMKVRDWFHRIGSPEEFPVSAEVELLFVELDGTLGVITSEPYPMLLEASQFAIGSGGTIARGLMHVGLSAELAVEKACEVNVYCGLGVDTLRLTGSASH